MTTPNRAITREGAEKWPQYFCEEPYTQCCRWCNSSVKHSAICIVPDLIQSLERIRELEKVVSDYADHTPFCNRDIYADGSCKCGFREAVKFMNKIQATHEE